MKATRKVAVIGAFAVLSLACTRITDDAGTQPTPLDTTPGPSATATGEPVRAAIFYVLEQRGRLFLVPETRDVIEPSPGAGRVAELIAGEPHDRDLSSPWPADTEVLEVTVEHGTAIVDLSAEALTANVGAELESLGIQAAVYTLTEMAGVDRVEFTVEGKESGEASNGRMIENWWGHVGLSEQPFSRAEDVLAPITIISPEEGATVSRTFTVTGEASTFEANVVVRVRDSSGDVIQTTFTTASKGAPERGTWRKELTLPDAPGGYTIEAVEEDAEQGGDFFVMTRSITLG